METPSLNFFTRTSKTCDYLQGITSRGRRRNYLLFLDCCLDKKIKKAAASRQQLENAYPLQCRIVPPQHERISEGDLHFKKNKPVTFYGLHGTLPPDCSGWSGKRDRSKGPFPHFVALR